MPYVTTKEGKKIWKPEIVDTVQPAAGDEKFAKTPGGIQRIKVEPVKTEERAPTVGAGQRRVLTGEEKARKAYLQQLAGKGGMFAQRFGALYEEGPETLRTQAPEVGPLAGQAVRDVFAAKPGEEAGVVTEEEKEALGQFFRGKYGKGFEEDVDREVENILSSYRAKEEALTKEYGAYEREVERERQRFEPEVATAGRQRAALERRAQLAETGMLRDVGEMESGIDAAKAGMEEAGLEKADVEKTTEILKKKALASYLGETPEYTEEEMAFMDETGFTPEVHGPESVLGSWLGDITSRGEEFGRLRQLRGVLGEEFEKPEEVAADVAGTETAMFNRFEPQLTDAIDEALKLTETPPPPAGFAQTGAVGAVGRDPNLAGVFEARFKPFLERIPDVIAANIVGDDVEATTLREQIKDKVSGDITALTETDKTGSEKIEDVKAYLADFKGRGYADVLTPAAEIVGGTQAERRYQTELERFAKKEELAGIEQARIDRVLDKLIVGQPLTDEEKEVLGRADIAREAEEAIPFEEILGPGTVYDPAESGARALVESILRPPERTTAPRREAGPAPTAEEVAALGTRLRPDILQGMAGASAKQLKGAGGFVDKKRTAADVLKTLGMMIAGR